MELLNERFKNADPFPHIILDNWIDDNQLSLVQRIYLKSLRKIKSNHKKNKLTFCNNI